ncbi:MAG: hypothetical protein WBL20_14495, partial [Sphingobium sp.]
MRTLLIASVTTALAFGMANASVSTTDPVDEFVRALAEAKWDVATKMVRGSISQLNGTGPEVVGGPHQGVWHERIVQGRTAVSASDLVSSIGSCSFGEARLLDGSKAESSDKVVRVSY